MGSWHLRRACHRRSSRREDDVEMGVLHYVSLLLHRLRQHTLAPNPQTTYCDNERKAPASGLDWWLPFYLIVHGVSHGRVVGRSSGALGQLPHHCTAGHWGCRNGGRHVLGSLWSDRTIFTTQPFSLPEFIHRILRCSGARSSGEPSNLHPAGDIPSTLC
jgi:hypothetical protein